MRFVLMLLDSENLVRIGNSAKLLETVLRALSRSTRETDVKGWYTGGSIIGVIFTDIGTTDGRAVAEALLTRVTKALSGVLAIDQIDKIKISFHVFPESRDENGARYPSDRALYPELQPELDPKKLSRAMKRSVDIVGSLAALVCLAPVFGLVALFVKLTSKGKILFRQERVGQHGVRFTFLKFRSMYSDNDPAVHEEYVKGLISGAQASEEALAGEPGVYKLTKDPRVTPIGRFLRRTSLDELPQFVNVLRGEMSLVGPRPPVPYEFDCYALWHKRRLLAVKPGITGLWQIGGRSTMKFDDMVRLDLAYARTWSVGMDIKILLRTPRAVFSGSGAY